MKLELKKQKVTKLSSNDMSNINGGGEKWSDFWSGNCKYSNNNAQPVELYDPATNDCITYTTSCVAATK